MKTNTSTAPLCEESGTAADAVLPQVDDRRTTARPPPESEDRRVAARDRRIATRMRVLKGAEIVLAMGPPIRCIVRNISETGARLEVHIPVLGNSFDLVFDDNEWPRRSCRIVWRSAVGIGVRFE